METKTKNIKNPNSKSCIAYIEVLLLTIIWGGSMVSSKFALMEFSSSFILAVRYIAGGLLLALLFPKHIKHLNFITLKYACTTGGVMYLGMVLHLYSLHFTSASHQSFILVSYTIIVPLLEWLWLKRSPPAGIIPAVILIITGVALISVTESSQWSYGDFVAVLFAIFYSFQLFLSGVWVKKCDMPAFTITMLFTVGALSTITCLLRQDYPHSLSALLIQPDILPALGGLFYLTVFNTAAAFLLQCHAQTQTNSTLLVLIMSMESVFGAIAAYLLLHEKFTIRTIIGSILVIIANLIVVIPKKRKPSVVH